MVTADLDPRVLMAGMAVATARARPTGSRDRFGRTHRRLGSVYDPATAAMVPQLLGEDNLAAGNALTETSTTSRSWSARRRRLVLLVGSPWS